MVKLKRKLIYSVLLFILSIALIIAFTLGWFNPRLANYFESLDLFYNGSDVLFYKTVDEDDDGYSDMEDGELVFVKEDPVQIITYYYPGFEVTFKADIYPPRNGGYIRAALLGLDLPSEQDPPNTGNTLDLADVMWVRYKDPNAPPEDPDVDVKMSDLILSGRDMDLFKNYHVTTDDMFVFTYTIYMHEDTEIEYSGMKLLIDKALFSVTSETI